MVMAKEGFITRTLFSFKSPFGLQLMERLHGKFTIKKSNQIHHYVPEVRDMVEKGHFISKAIVVIGKLSKDADKAIMSDADVFVSLEVGDSFCMKEVGKIEKMHSILMGRLKKKGQRKLQKELEKVFKDKLLAPLNYAADAYGKEYNRIMILINNLNMRTKQSFMAGIKTLINTSGRSIADYMLIRHELKEVWKNWSNLKKDVKRMSEMSKVINNYLKGKKAKFKGALIDSNEKLLKLYGILATKIGKEVGKYFVNSHKAKMRDTIILFGIIDDMHEHLRNLERWDEKRFMPKKTLVGNEAKIHTIFTKLLDIAHTEAQGIRRNVKQERELVAALR